MEVSTKERLVVTLIRRWLVQVLHYLGRWTRRRRQRGGRCSILLLNIIVPASNHQIILGIIILMLGRYLRGEPGGRIIAPDRSGPRSGRSTRLVLLLHVVGCRGRLRRHNLGESTHVLEHLGMTLHLLRKLLFLMHLLLLLLMMLHAN